MKRVFVVDDSMFIVTQLTQLLKKGGYEIAGYAVDGQEAVNKFREIAGEIDIVTLDITMPGLDGVSVLKQLKSAKPEAKVIIISAIGKEQTVMRTREYGADGYIIKPLSSDKVLSRIKSIAN